MSEAKPANALAQAASSYLRSAAHQPVRWREWGEDAFETARREDKPILLDIGAVWCHWCHVMDRESYESEDVARLINQNFVAVKVDRDERPDIDARYQMAVSALTGQGGWPLTAFLTPDGKPFFGGTYFPPDDYSGRPGMKRVLENVAQNYRTHKAEILHSADRIYDALGAAEAFASNGEKAGASLVGRVIESVAQMFDHENGGFGSSPKFPHPSGIDLLLDAFLETGESPLLSMVSTTLEHMGRGGVYDQLAGGFHRYSVDARWIVPHFEKMSYDNAGLLVNYLRAYQITSNDFFRQIALGILAFVENVLTAPEGGFYASQDADYSLDDDGDYFTWTLDELKAALSESEAAAAALYYHVEAQGEMHHNPAKNVLFIDQPLGAIAARLKMKVDEVETILDQAKSKMLAARLTRPTPFVDTTIYASWNGMMISALLEAYKVLGLEGARDRALMTLDLLLAKAYDPAKGMGHAVLRKAGDAPGSAVQYRVSNFDLLDDQVFMAQALIDAFEVTGRTGYFDRALELADTTVRRFWDAEGGGFFDTARDRQAQQGALEMRRKSFQDSPTPAGNSMAVLVLDRIAHLADRPDLRQKAEATLDLFAPKAADYGLFASTYALALVNHLRPPVEVVVVGAASDPRTRGLAEAARKTPRASKRVLAFEPETVRNGSLPAGLRSTLPNLPLDGAPLALVCVGTSCQPPVSTPEELAAILAKPL